MSSTPQPPRLGRQSVARTVFRVLGVIALVAALSLLVTGGIDLFSATDSFEQPTRFWMFFVGIPLMAVAGWLLQAGFLGAGARYVSGELSPVAKETTEYLTGGKGLANLGVRETADSAGPGAAPGPYCRSCGTHNDADARYCDSCGSAMA